MNLNFVSLKAAGIYFFWICFFAIKVSAQNPTDSTALVLPDSAKISYEDSIRTVVIDSLKRNSDLESPLKYSARDSIVFDVLERKLYLYGDASLKYQKMDLKSYIIRVDWKDNLIYAEGKWDSTLNDSVGGFIDTPVFKDGDDTYYAEKMKYNFKTKKGSIISVKTNQSGDVLLGDSIRINPDKSFFIKGGKFTTCDHDPPHFYIQSSKLKVIPNDKIISGPLLMVVEKLPIPLIIPFGFFPFNSKRTSGIVLPQYGESQRLGFFFQRMGYYWAFSRYADVFFKGDIYTKGSWQLGLESNYNKRYLMRGKLDFNIFREKSGDILDPDFSKSTLIKFTWNHTQTFSPTATINANVNYTTNNYYRRATFNNPNQIFNNTIQSSVNFSKSFPNTPWSLTAAANAIQYVDKQQVDLSIPSLNISRARTFPFKRKKSFGQARWYEQIGLDYNSTILNKLNTFDSLLLRPDVWDKMQNGMKQTAALSTGFSVFKYFRISPSFSYNEYWYSKTIEKQFLDRPEPQADTIIINQNENFAATRDFQFTTSLNTNLYGIFGGKNVRFRHTVRPNLSYTWRPDFSESRYQNYLEVATNASGEKVKYSRFEQGVVGGPPNGKQKMVAFSLANVLEMKLPPSKADTSGKNEPRRITVIDNFGLNLNYNFAADSLKMSNITFNFRNNVLDNKLNINLSSTLDPYQFVQVGSGFQKINQFYWDSHKKLGRFTNWNLSVGTSIRSKDKPKDKVWKNKEREAKVKSLYEEYTRFYIPFSLNLSYNLNYDRPFHDFTLTQTLRADGRVQLTPKWGIDINTGYDFVNKKMAYTNVGITRDLHCWEMRFSWIPFGNFKSYNLTINVKAQTLQDLRLQKRRVWQDNF